MDAERNIRWKLSLLFTKRIRWFLKKIERKRGRKRERDRQREGGSNAIKNIRTDLALPLELALSRSAVVPKEVNWTDRSFEGTDEVSKRARLVDESGEDE